MSFAGVHLQDISQLLRFSRLQSTQNATLAAAAIDLDDYAGFAASDLFAPSRSERSFFILSIAFLFVLSLCGNILTLCVNCRRRMRPIFRVCLNFLACSDLLTTFLLSVTYMSQFTAEYVQYWKFGAPMCHLIPFLSTSTVMVSSLLLVGIAADRYFAVRKPTVEVWNPSGSLCMVCMLLIWAAAISISSPIFFIYELVSVYIVDDLSEGERLPLESGDPNQPKLVVMCVSNKDKVGISYMIVFLIIFIPCILAFVWLNGIIALTIWQRRRPISAAQQPPPQPVRRVPHPQPSSSPKAVVQLLTIVTSGDINNGATTPPPPATPTVTHTAKSATTAAPRSPRELRHIRMFVVILLMMLVFLVGRLPAWVLLIVRMYGAYTEELHWRLYFYFGLLHLASCMMNPLFYTFLSETIEFSRRVKMKVFNTACGMRLCCSCSRNALQQMRVPPMPTANYGAEEDGAQRIAALPPDDLSPYRIAGCNVRCAGRLRRKFRISAKWQAEMAERMAEERRHEESGERDEGVDVRSDYSGSGSASGSSFPVAQRKCLQVYTIQPSPTVLKWTRQEL